MLKVLSKKPDKSYRDKEVNMKCPNCKSEKYRKYGSYKTNKGKTQVYRCKDCNKNFSRRTNSINYRKRKQHLREKITKAYCEKMSLSGIARTLNIHRNTVVKYFRENAELARKANEERLGNDLLTSYVQFDQLETYEHTKRKPVGIQISMRPKTNEVISAKVGYIPVRALTISKTYSQEWNRKAHKSLHIQNMIFETKKALKKSGATLSCDRARNQVKIVKDFCLEDHIKITPTEKRNKKIDMLFRRIRNDISRLNRKTICTTKNISQLQNHLDLWIDYHNVKRAS